MSRLETILSFQMKTCGIDHVPEYRFHDERKWRFDFAIPDKLIGIECEGGIFSGGAHTRGRHYESDMEKYNAAAMLGWKVLRFSGDMIETGYAINMIKNMFNGVDDTPRFNKTKRARNDQLAKRRIKL